MLNNVVIDLMPEDGMEWECPTLLDVNAVTPLLKWLDADTNQDFAARLVDERWRIGVIEGHIESRPNWTSLKKRLENKKIEIIEYTFGREDMPLVAEIQRAYFGSDADSRTSAELLAYGRRNNDGGNVRIISRHRCFRLVPNVQLFYLDKIQEIGQEDDATMLRLLQSLDLHEDVRRAAFQRVLNHEYPVAVVETVKTLFLEVQQMLETAHPETAKLDGYQLIHQAFDCAEEKKKDGKVTPERLPKIRINKLSKESEWSEQKGFRDLGCGAASAIRNPISHTTVDSDFIRKRFGDRRTALKFLCMLSLLFEKLDDATVAP